MVKVGFFNRLFLNLAGRRDAKGQYMRDLTRYDLSNVNYPSSQFMIHLAEEYSKKCQWKVARQRSLPKLYLRIIQEYEEINKIVSYYEDETARLNKAKSDLDRQLVEDESNEKKAVMDFAQANKTGVVTSEMGARTLFGLSELVDQLKMRREDTEKKISSLEEQLSRRTEGLKELKSQNSSKITAYLNQYRQKLDTLAGQLKLISLEYEERFDIYWNAFLKKSMIKEAMKKSLEDLCEEQGGDIYTKDDLYIEERKMINNDIKKIVGFDVEV